MTGLVEAVRAEVDDKCLKSGRCRKDGCCISLKCVPKRHLVIDFDKQGSPLEGQTRCDYLFVADLAGNEGWIVPLELKSGRYKAGKVVKQLEAGTRFAEGIISRKLKIRFWPVLVFKKAPRQAEILKLRSSKIRFHGNESFIRLFKCGDKLAEKLREES